MSPNLQAVDSPSQAPAFLQLSEIDIMRKFNELEMQQRERISKGISADRDSTQWARLSGREILERNRYLNIDPWANNRIHLQVPTGQCDYINASPIKMTGSRSEQTMRYIATQGPKESSSQHFWQMIWQETGSVGVIVMLTQFHELGREKCFGYFPHDTNSSSLEINPKSQLSDAPPESSDEETEDEEDAIDATTPKDTDTGFHARVELLETCYEEKTRSTVRKLRLEVGDEAKIVWHYFFEGWPDFSVPQQENRVALLQLVSESARVAGSTENPRVVHCSAGVGRSGTFIALDYLLRELKDGVFENFGTDRDFIADTVNELRKQRMMMVQGESQFHFLYEILRDEWLQKHGLEAAAAAAAAATSVTATAEEEVKIVEHDHIEDENDKGPNL